MFTDAWFSFPTLRLYYEHMVALLRRSSNDIQKSGEQLEIEYEEKRKKFNKQAWQNFHKVFEEIYPGFFNNSFLISVCSLFEYQIKKIFTLVKEEHKLPIEWDDLNGNIPTRAKSFLNLAGVTLKDDPPKVVLRPPNFVPTTVPDESRIIMKVLWEEIENYFMVRNCIAHHNGLIQKARNSDKVKKYAMKKGIFVDKEGQLELLINEDFNKEACNTMEEFFQKLTDAYYGTPLPD